MLRFYPVKNPSIPLIFSALGGHLQYIGCKTHQIHADSTISPVLRQIKT